MFKGTDTVNVPLRLQELLDVVVQEVLLDVLVPRHQLHVVDLQCFTIKERNNRSGSTEVRESHLHPKIGFCAFESVVMASAEYEVSTNQSTVCLQIWTNKGAPLY